ncbi:helix-turn-helix domain-containing protein [uncultured Flavonifractor sp.]|uniref:helix-turn-helix domain-containing protein n=1 Tax=uncultured Flavonifractor sp. TaxID=1193534 RepID=UPI0025988ADE|nr:helix-turn-helix domain-containing protein [uncultured Flavonifractor sp.]
MSDFFLNGRYKVLKCMAARQISVNGEMIVKLSQQEIADILNFTKPKVNAIIKELKDAGYIVQHSARGKYSLTSKAKDELNTMSEMGAQV